HPSGHTRLHWTPCGAVIAVGFESGRCERWRVDPTNEPTLAPLDREGRWLAFSRSGSALLVAGDELLEIDLATAEVRERFARPQFDIEFPIAFENGFLAHLELWREGRWRVWELRIQSAVLGTDGESFPSHSLSFSSDARYLVASPDLPFEPLRAWDLSNGTEVFRTPLGSDHAKVEFATADRFVQTSWSDQGLHVWDVETRVEERPIVGHCNTVESVSFSPSGDRLASIGEDATARVWSTSTGIEIARFRGPQHYSRFIDFLDEDHLIVPRDGDLATIDLRSGATHPLAARDVACTPEAAHELWRYPCPTMEMCVSTDRRWLFSLNDVRDLGTGDVTRLALEGDPTLEDRQRVACSPDGRRVVLSSNIHSTVSVFDARTGARIRSLEAGGSVHALAFHPETGDLYLVVRRTEDYATSQWDVTTGELRGERPLPSVGPLDMSFSPSGDRYALGDQAGEIWIHRTDDGSVLACIDAHLDWVRSVRFSPDGRSLASCSEDNTVRLWALSPFDPVRWNDADLDAWRFETGLTPLDGGSLLLHAVPGTAYRNTPLAEQCGP
ncbi:MAG: hypothetical protein KDC38_19460, partial [Planctomycetes bacterium]|nr:hypothetical protein [Planctomycetota bacterium]